MGHIIHKNLARKMQNCNQQIKIYIFTIINNRLKCVIVTQNNFDLDLNETLSGILRDPWDTQ